MIDNAHRAQVPQNAINVAHNHGGAAISIVVKREIDRRHADPVVGDGKVELDAEGCPGAAIARRGFLD
jgi:hypothetical protein